jgi:iron complex outermembrane receptor protein
MVLCRIAGARRRNLGYIMHINTVKRALMGATMLAAAAGAFNTPLHAQGIGQRQDEIIVTASLQGTPTAPTPEAARKEPERVSGATGLVENEGFCRHLRPIDWRRA